MMRRVVLGVVIAALMAAGLSSPVTASAASPHLAGRLVTQTGAPMAKVKIQFTVAFGVGHVGKTDANGRFTTSLAETDGHVTIAVPVAGHSEQFSVPVHRETSKNIGDIVFSTRSTVTGTLDKTPKSVALTIDLVNRAGAVVASQYLDGDSRKYAFSWGKPGTYTVRASTITGGGWTYLGHTGEFEKARFVSVSPTTRRTAALSFSKTPTGSLSGRVVSTGTPAPDTSAAFRVLRVGAPASDLVTVYADDNGTFSAAKLPPGTYRVTKFDSTVKSLKNTKDVSRFTVVAGKTTKIGTFRLPASYFATGWGD